MKTKYFIFCFLITSLFFNLSTVSAQISDVPDYAYVLPEQIQEIIDEKPYTNLVEKYFVVVKDINTSETQEFSGESNIYIENESNDLWGEIISHKKITSSDGSVSTNNINKSIWAKRDKGVFINFREVSGDGIDYKNTYSKLKDSIGKWVQIYDDSSISHILDNEYFAFLTEKPIHLLSFVEYFGYSINKLNIPNGPTVIKYAFNGKFNNDDLISYINDDTSKDRYTSGFGLYLLSQIANRDKTLEIDLITYTEQKAEGNASIENKINFTKTIGTKKISFYLSQFITSSDFVDSDSENISSWESFSELEKDVDSAPQYDEQKYRSVPLKKNLDNYVDDEQERYVPGDSVENDISNINTSTINTSKNTSNSTQTTPSKDSICQTQWYGAWYNISCDSDAYKNYRSDWKRVLEDKCTNINGYQSSAPSGYEQKNNNTCELIVKNEVKQEIPATENIQDEQDVIENKITPVNKTCQIWWYGLWYTLDCNSDNYKNYRSDWKREISYSGKNTLASFVSKYFNSIINYGN